jgi:RimJ/RimL family protein N-acetyltransferase
VAGDPHEDFRRIRSPFEGALVRIRAVEEDDLERLNELIWQPGVTRYLHVTWPESIEETRAWWQSSRSAADQRTFAIETLAGEVIGSCGLREIDSGSRTADLGLFIGEPYWNLGYGTDVVRLVCRFGFREMNLQRVTLSVFENNPRGVRAYEKVGFKEEGRLRRDHFVDGAYLDTILMGLLAEELIED